MNLLLTATIFIVSCLALVRAGTWIIRSLTRIARFLKWREFTVAFILMAFATSVPEFFVGIGSAFHGQPQLSLGNIIGSNLINLTLVVALVVILAKGIRLEGALVKESSIYTMFLVLLPILLMMDGAISRVDGIVLFIGLLFYYSQLKEQEQRFTRIFVNELKRDWSELKTFFKDLGIFFGGIMAILITAEGIVWSASGIALWLGLPLTLVGALIVALGTNLPEIVFGLKGLALEHKDMVLGGIMGSVVANSTLVLGTTVLISPLEIYNFQPYLVGLVFTVLTVTAFAIFSRSKSEINRKEALALLLIYFAFVVIEILMV